MASGLEVIGALAAASQLAEQILGVLRFIDNVRDAPQDVLEHVSSLQHLIHVVERIEATPSYQSPQVAAILASIQRKVEAVSNTLNKLQATSSDGKGILLKKAVIATFSEENTTSRLDQIERDKTTLALCLAQIDAQVQADLVKSLTLQLQNLRHGSDTSGFTEEQWKNYCLGELYITNPTDDRATLIRTKGDRCPGTCAWVTASPAYCSWKEHNSTSPILWISGGPGKGKTMISVFLTEELEKAASQTNGRTEQVVYFFCDNKDNRRNSASCVLRGLILMLLRSDPDLIAHILTEFKIQKSRLFEELSFEPLWRVFEVLVHHTVSESIFCVLDALDELSESALAILLPKLRTLNFPKIKVVILSRHFPESIKEALCDHPGIRLDPDFDSDVGKDVETYLIVMVRELARTKRYPPLLEDQVLETLKSRSNGTFLWLSFAVDILRTASLTDTESCLASLPAGLGEIYTRILMSIDSRNAQTVHAMLKWATLAVRPLTLRELGTALGIQPTWSLTLSEITKDKVQLCSGLLVMDRDQVVDDEQVTLVHQSLKDYLLLSKTDEGLGHHRVDPDTGNLEIALTCLKFLHQKWPKDHTDDRALMGDTRRTFFLDYAARHWPTHAQMTTLFRTHGRDAFVSFFVGQMSSGRSWFLCYIATRIGSYVLRPDWQLLHQSQEFELAFVVATGLHLSPLALDLWPVSKTRDKLIRTRKYKRGKQLALLALPIATTLGNESICRFLIDQGVDVNSTTSCRVHGYRDPYGVENCSPLDLAIIHKHENVIKLLVSKGASVETKDSDGKKPLHKAVKASLPLPILVLLLEAGSDVLAVDGAGQTPLHHACEKGDEVTMKWLLEAGAIAGPTNRGDTPLHILVSTWSEVSTTTIDLLLGLGISIDCRNQSGQTPLHSAINVGAHHHVVAYLLHKGANVSAEDNCRNHAIHEAAWWGRASSIVALLENGADVSARNIHGRTPLHNMAEMSNDGDMLRVLVEYGADVNVADNEDNRPINLAAQAGHASIVDLLIKIGAHVKLVNQQDETPFENVQECLAALTRLLHDVDLGLDVRHLAYEDFRTKYAKETGAKMPLDVADLRGTMDAYQRILEILRAAEEGQPVFPQEGLRGTSPSDLQDTTSEVQETTSTNPTL